MRLVLDSNVLVAGLRSDLGASRRILAAALDRRFCLLLSVPLVIEYEAVLTRPEQLDASGLTSSEVEQLLDGLVSVAEPVRLSFHWRPTLSDPLDDMVLETAINGSADLLVTFNARHFVPAMRRFRLSIGTPADALTEIGE